MDMYSLGIKNISAQSNGDPPFTKQDMKQHVNILVKKNWAPSGESQNLARKLHNLYLPIFKQKSFTATQLPNTDSRCTKYKK